MDSLEAALANLCEAETTYNNALSRVKAFNDVEVVVEVKDGVSHSHAPNGVTRVFTHVVRPLR